MGFSQTEWFFNETDGIVSLVVVKEGDSEIETHIEFTLEDGSATGMCKICIYPAKVRPMTYNSRK